MIKGPGWVWGSAPSVQASGGTHVATTSKGAYTRLAFTGTGITWLGIRDSCSGLSTVSIDGVAVKVDAYAAPGTGGWQQAIFSRKDLPDGDHTLEITVLAKKNRASCGNWVYLDAFDIERPASLSDLTADSGLESDSGESSFGGCGIVRGSGGGPTDPGRAASMLFSIAILFSPLLLRVRRGILNRFAT